MRLYNARLQHQGEACERRERRDSCPKSHRELLEAIPEALAVQPQCQRLQVEMEDGTGSIMDLPPRGLFRVSSVQFHKADRPCLNRHSSSSGALFNPSHAHAAVSRINAPVLSTCSTPSSHRRPLVPIQQQHHEGSSSVGMLRRSRTLHHRPPPQEYRRRASHPSSPSYCAETLHHCGGVPQHNVLPPGLGEEGELVAGVMASHPATLAVPPQQHPNALGHIRSANTHERCYDNNANAQIAHHDWWHSQEKKHDARATGGRKGQRDEEGTGTTEAGDVNDTWPKPANRQSQGGGGGRGLYSTLEGHTGAGCAVGWDAKKGHINENTCPNPCSGIQLKPNPIAKPNTTSRVSRNQLLRDRASQLADERSGMSTDEETNTDMLMGRYWSRMERREHFLLAREQKQQQMQARGTTLRDTIARGGTIAGGGGVSVGEGSMLDNRGGGRSFCRREVQHWLNNEDRLCTSSLLTVTTV
ncbi:hypothetical protein KUCAC02_030509 [Chaenocephalus aceratus]|uniref:Uncharacterized protein n=1 Tax=Chaenocephalus aceratus TaxID=36190 RepID=A0ACB9XL47_CHAAC|nr:hypothetical protein KUCAC02_030509 [Chaenocephalus aceratus]